MPKLLAVAVRVLRPTRKHISQAVRFASSQKVASTIATERQKTIIILVIPTIWQVPTLLRLRA